MIDIILLFRQISKLSINNNIFHLFLIFVVQKCNLKRIEAAAAAAAAAAANKTNFTLNLSLKLCKNHDITLFRCKVDSDLPRNNGKLTYFCDKVQGKKGI